NYFAPVLARRFINPISLKVSIGRGCPRVKRPKREGSPAPIGFDFGVGVPCEKVLVSHRPKKGRAFLFCVGMF
ncbi:hypothetical protein OE165_28750, partial [Escherichia coli]